MSKFMSFEDEALARLNDAADRFCELTGKTRAHIGQMAVNDNTFFPRLAEGNSTTIRRCSKVMSWLRENWPEGHEFPDHRKLEAAE